MLLADARTPLALAGYVSNATISLNHGQTLALCLVVLLFGKLVRTSGSTLGTELASAG